MRLQLASVALFFILFTGSCMVPKDVVYFQGIDDLTKGEVEAMYQKYDIRVCPDDLLTISVTAWDQTVAVPFNPSTFTLSATEIETQAQGQRTTATNNTVQTPTYLVDSEGDIQFPVIGKVHVAGLTIRELSDKLQGEIAHYIDKPLVHAQLSNFKVNVIGEVTRPGPVMFMSNERVSVLDAISIAGDLTINANRHNILIIRDNNGKKEYARLNIMNTSLFSSPYFYLKQNDVVYVEPNAAKIRNAHYSQAQQYNVSLFSSIFSAVNIMATLLLAITRR
ncbi:polysaccharide export protein Wza [Bacteroidales bacterium Barb7]|nr:polysaccharide export protein Wza [Bacteroidales bacterium Barb7]